MTSTRYVAAVSMAGLLFLGSPAGLVAQDLEFEQVGDQPIDATDLAYAPNQTLWGSSISDLWRLSPSGLWMEVGSFFGDYILVLSSDTVLVSFNAGTHRSLDGGKTFAPVFDSGGALYNSESGLPNSDLILLGAGESGISYSTDRGASFTEATVLATTFRESELHSAVEIPDGPAAGRLVAGAFNGILTSEDGGRTWTPSSLFQDFRYSVQRVVIGAGPETGDRQLYATLTDSQAPDAQFYFSDDDGLTWTHIPDVPDAFLFVYVPPGSAGSHAGSLISVECADAIDGEHLNVWRSVDGGQTWTDVAELPAEVNGGAISSTDALIGPDDHLYVAVNRNGPEREWVYRSTEPVVVASEPDAPPEPAAERLVVFPNPAAISISVEGIASGVDVVLYDVLGRALLRTRKTTDIDVSALPPGSYVVRVAGKSRVVTVRR